MAIARTTRGRGDDCHDFGGNRAAFAGTNVVLIHDRGEMARVRHMSQPTPQRGHVRATLDGLARADAEGKQKADCELHDDEVVVCFVEWLEQTTIFVREAIRLRPSHGNTWHHAW